MISEQGNYTKFLNMLVLAVHKFTKSLYKLDSWVSMFKLSKWACYCFGFALVQYVVPLCVQWPVRQLFPAAWTGSTGKCSVYLFDVYGYTESLRLTNQHRILRTQIIPLDTNPSPVS